MNDTLRITALNRNPYTVLRNASSRFDVFTAAPEVNRVYHCEALMLLRALPDGSVDAFICDPPYGNGTQVSARRSPDERFKEIPGVDRIHAEWIPEAYRALKTGGAIYMFAKWVNVGEWQAHLKDAGFIIKNCIIWDKLQHGTGDLEGSFAPQYEMILFATKGRHKLRGVRLPDIVKYPKVQPGELIHPYEKPVGLLETFVRCSTDIDGLVIDPFMGSCSTGYATKKQGRRFIGCDVTLEYVEIARQRLSQPYTPDMFLQASGE